MGSLAEKLKDHLNKTTPEQFEKDWKEIEKLGLEGPTVDEYLKQLENEMLEIAGIPLDKFNSAKI